ncbi:MAG: hypothetical protein ACREFE_00270, partial [Limisphaerales bacterium]
MSVLAARFHSELVGAPVHSWNLRSFGWEAGLRYQCRRNSACGHYSSFIQIGRHFAIRVREALKRRTDLDSESIFFAYDTGALEAMEWCRERGIKCVLNQMDPNRVEMELVREEEKMRPGWAMRALQVPEAYFQRREKEWALANQVMVNSNFCRAALVKQGVP